MSVRQFFGLGPPDDVRGQLAAVAQRMPLKAVLSRAENLHITLAFLGSVGAKQQAALCSAAADLQHEPFELQIDCAGTFPNARVLWLGMEHPPDALYGLQSDLVSRLQAACPELSVWERQGGRYCPHVTIQRKFKSSAAELAFAPIRWAVRDFCLYVSERSGDGSAYRVVDCWPLKSSDC